MVDATALRGVRRIAVAGLALAAAAGCATGGARTTSGSPEVAARAFYEEHLAHDMAFTAEGLTARERWIAPDLLALCRAWLARPASPDEAPAIEGDPFTDSQEYPTSFRVLGARATGDRADVTVRFARPRSVQHTVHLILVRAAGRWLVSDVTYEDGKSLRGLLGAARG